MVKRLNVKLSTKNKTYLVPSFEFSWSLIRGFHGKECVPDYYYYDYSCVYLCTNSSIHWLYKEIQEPGEKTNTYPIAYVSACVYECYLQGRMQWSLLQCDNTSLETGDNP